jgi:hypothetical protein
MQEDAKLEEENSEPVNINIVKKDHNKENLVGGAARSNRMRPPPAVGGGQDMQKA